MKMESNVSVSSSTAQQTATDMASTQSTTHKTVMNFLHDLSGQTKQTDVTEVDHNYSKPWNQHPDSSIRAKPAKFLFMKNFPKHFLRQPKSGYNEPVDVLEVTEKRSLMSVLNACGDIIGTQHLKTLSSSKEEEVCEMPSPPKANWSTQMTKIWNKTVKILNSDRLARLAYEGANNEAILKRNLTERTANKFRQLFASGCGWDLNLLTWLNNTLVDHVGSPFIRCYHECMHLLRLKIPTLVDKFYAPSKCDANVVTRLKQQPWDPIQALLNNYRPKRINGSPLFLIVPNGPQIPHQMTSQRMKHWHNLFGSLGKVITISVVAKPYETVLDCLNDIRIAVKDKIKECKSTFNEGRPLVLIGFGHSSLIAAHCALDNSASVTATICLGFPLTAINGFRGDLDDPLLETTVPILFLIGQNSTMATLDDMEDFRERITKTETGLVVIGGANDRLVVSSSKMKFDCITQAIVDRCIADEIHEFVTGVLNPTYTNVGSDPNASTSIPSSPRGSGSRSNKASSSGLGSPNPKPKRKRPTKPRERSTAKKPRTKPTDKAEPQPKASPVSEPLTQSSSIAPSSTPQPPLSTMPPPSSQLPTIPTPSTMNVLPSTSPSQANIQTPLEVNAETPLSGQVTPTQISPDSGGTPKLERHYGFSYHISEVPTVISQGATRAGRQIRAPKSLDV